MPVLKVWNGSSWVEIPVGITDHGGLTGLGDDDHSSLYPLTDGTRPFVFARSTVTTNTTLTTSQTVALCNAASGAITITLPVVSGNDGRRYFVKKIDSSGNAVTVDGNGSETIDGATTQVLASQYDSAEVVSDGTEWWIV